MWLPDLLARQKFDNLQNRICECIDNQAGLFENQIDN